MTRSTSTQRRILDLPSRPERGLGETGPSVSPDAAAQARRELVSTLHRLVEALTELDDSAVAPAQMLESDLPLLLDATEAGRLMSISRVKVLDLAGCGEIPSIRVGRSVRIPRDQLIDWINGRTEPLAGIGKSPRWTNCHRSHQS